MTQFILCTVGLAFLLTSASFAQAQVTISEFMANNTKTLADQDRDYSDWIEIHNEGGSPVNLDGWSLTDSIDQPRKWRFPGVTLGANGFLIVFASGKDRAAVGSELHANFSLDADGEYLALVRPDGGIATEFAPKFPEQLKDTSYGSVQGIDYYFSKPTAGASNGAGFIALVSDTKFSQDRGFYDTPFDLTISTATTNAIIRCSTNGIPPSATNGFVYAGPIRISGTTTVRASASRSGYLPSNVDTHTYIFLEDVIRQAPTGQPPPGWPSSWGSNTRDYGMDPDVVNNPLYSGTIKSDLKTLPSFSIVMNLNDLFNATTGIYANPGQDGRDWERPASIELINPDGSKGFQIDAGLRIRGGFSRSTGNPKHAFRFFFREDYGEPKLKYPLFGDQGTDTFDAIDLRTFQNYSWSFQGDPTGVFLRDQFSRDTQMAMGHQTERGNFYHLYINGQYWGLYNTDERPEASYGETYFGGNKDDYDVIKVEAGSYNINATDGDMTAWTQLYNLAKAGFVTNDAYQRVQGKNPDGTRNPAYPNLLDLPNLIDYMLVIFYGGNLDAPISNFLGNTSPNNWYGMRNRNGSDGFRFFAHDSEHTLLNVNENRTGPYTSGDTSVLKSNPQWIWQKLGTNAEFRLLAADHIHRHFFNGGSLTPSAARERFLQRKNEIDRAVVGESARWGDAKRAAPLTRNVDWLAAINNILNNYFPRRTDIVLSQLRTKGFYPNVVAPSFNQFGGNIDRGFRLSMTAPAGTIYYTVDGSDPRLPGGAVAPAALTYSSPRPLEESTWIKSRVLSGTNWSALNEAGFTVIQTFKDLLITEIMYNPPTQNGRDGDDFEFIELKNVGAAELDLSGVRFAEGLNFTFPIGTKVGPGQFVVLASQREAFASKYPGVRLDGTYAGHLSNSGEPLTLVHAAGAALASVTYSNQSPWPLSPDNAGFSLVPMNPNLNPDLNNPANWRASFKSGGSPGQDDPAATIGGVWINELLAHTDPVETDAVELYNASATSADISHWFLTDDRSVPKKFRIPAGTVIPAGGYLVFKETHFNPAPGVEPSFTFSSHGEEVYLYSADASGNLTGYSDGFSFGASANGVSFGRYTNSIGEIQHPAELRQSLGSANAGPRVGPVVINEINYHPKPGDEAFIELKNISPDAVKLYNPNHPTNTWRLSGIAFDFPMNLELPAQGLLLVVGSDPSAFRTRYGIPSSLPVLGPYSGVLQENGELLQLQRPDDPDTATNGAVIVPYITVDELRYNNRAPWPTNAAGGGSSLERINAAAYGNDPANWRGSLGPASPGLDSGGNRTPRIDAGIDQVLQGTTFPVIGTLTGAASDDGLPNPPGVLSIAWSQVGGPGAVVIANPKQLNTTASFPGLGSYRLRLTVDDGAAQTSDELTVVIERAPAQITLVSKGSVWKYLDNGSNQGTAWRAPGFNDASWVSGQAQLGYGDGDEAKVVSFGPDTANRYATTYFRRSFLVTNAKAVSQLTAKLLRDDGAVVYLNGTEIFRSNMPEDEITFATLASSNVAGADELTFYEKGVDPSLLVEGINVLAVEVHQITRNNSADLSFDLELSGLAVPPNQPPTVTAGNDLTVASMVAALNGAATDDGLPNPPGRLALAWSQVSGPGSVTFSATNAANPTATFGASGTYVLRLTAQDGELSAQDDVTVTVTGESLAAWKARFFSTAELANPAVSGDSADPDGDGHTNAQEHIAGTDPRDVRSALKLAATRLAGGTTKLVFGAVAGKAYTIQYRDSLTTGAWLKLSDVPAQPSASVLEIPDTNAGGGGRYYRIVTPQL
jgi:hypothetical protein